MPPRRDVDPVGIVEIAERLNVAHNTVSQWRNRHGDFPQPRWTVSRMPAWDWTEIVTWLEATGRTRYVPAPA